MASSTPSQNSSGSGGGNRNRNRSRNRSGTRNRGGRPRSTNPEDSDSESSDHRSGRSYGGSRSGYTKEKVPRRAPKKSLFQKILGVFGMGEVAEAKKKNSSPNPLARVGSTRVPEPGSRPETTPSRRSQRPERSERAESRPAKPPRPPREPKPRRAPENVEVTCERLYVGNLSYDAGENDLKEFFSSVGSVQVAEVVSHKNTQRSKGYAFLEMGSIDEARRAVDELHDKEFMGRKVVVSGAKSVGRQRADSTADEDEN